MFKNPFSFEGRVRRLEYGLSFIIYLICYLIIMGIVQGVGGAAAITGILFIPMVWFIWAQSAKRCHDIGRSGWYQLIPFYFFFLLFEDGEAGVNTYGSNPKNPSQLSPAESETLDAHLRS